MSINREPTHIYLHTKNISFLKRSQFPKDFIFGTASSAFQIEGAADEDGRKPSIWDTFAEDHDLVTDGHSWAHGVGHYHRYKEDVEIMKYIGLDAYRFSISWSRILPNGTKAGGENPAGIKFYNDLINELLHHGIEPMVTLFHWDLPQALEDKYGGFLDSRIIEDFRDYADVCFREFGDRVKYWITLNEPWTFCNFGYAMGFHAPGRGYDPRQTEARARYRRSIVEKEEELLSASPFSHPPPSMRALEQEDVELLPSTPYCHPPPPCRSDIYERRGRVEGEGNPGTEPYIVAHNQLLAHGTAVKLYRDKYQHKNKGQIGMALVTIWPEPYSDKPEDKSAADRVLDFYFGWFMELTITGDYPSSMREHVKDQLPVFTPEQSELLKGSYDFLGLNYYTANYVRHAPHVANLADHYTFHPLACFPRERDGKHIGDLGDSEWLYAYPEGIYKLLTYIKKKYNNPLIYITENGLDEKDDPGESLWVSLFDHKRVAYYHDHLLMVKKAIEEGTKVKGYFSWSIFDNFEWTYAFSSRFGNNFIDYKNNLARYPKLSSGWFKFLLEQ